MKTETRTDGLKALVLAMVMIGMSVVAEAGLVRVGTAAYGGHQYSLIYEPAQNLVWLDYRRPANTWSNQMQWVNSLGGEIQVSLDPEFKVNNVDWKSWRLPVTVDGVYNAQPMYNGIAPHGYNVIAGEMGYLFYVTLGNAGLYDIYGNPEPEGYVGGGIGYTGPFASLTAHGLYWTGTEYWETAGYHVWYFGFDSGIQNLAPNMYHQWAMAVTEGTIQLPPGDVFPGPGDGSAASPYQISTPPHLAAVNHALSAHYMMVSDISLEGVDYTQAVIAPDPDNPFNGNFDGGGKVVSGLIIDQPEADYLGLFGAVGENGIITDIAVVAPAINGRDHVGGLAGSGSGLITDCYAVVPVAGIDRVGGLIGHNRGSVLNCYSAGSVLGVTEVGGLCGRNDGSVQASFWDTESSGQSGSAGGAGQNSVRMTDPDIYIAAGWDLFRTWSLPDPELEPGYPGLLWLDFEPGQYLVVVSAEPGSGGAVGGSGSYEQGREVTVTAVPAAGWGFVGWSEDGEVVSGDSEYTFTIESDRLLKARFGVFHPADLDGDWRISISEMTAYVAGWRRAENPIDYAMRAVYIWRRGESYSYHQDRSGAERWQPMHP